MAAHIGADGFRGAVLSTDQIGGFARGGFIHVGAKHLRPFPGE
jgi:hypothetical protein